MTRLVILGVVLCLSTAARADDGDLDLDGLYDSIAEDLAGGKPLVVQVHVPLCDSSIIRCGNDRLGDGDNPSTNLYWATGGGFKGWFGKSRAWKQVLVETDDDGPILEKRVWKRHIEPRAVWRKRGVKKAFDVYVVAFAWRGVDIRKAIDRYVRDLRTDDVTEVELDDGTTLRAGGAAHIVSYVGHNGWMDFDYDWSSVADEGERSKGAIAIACMTADYLAEPLSKDHDLVPVLMTTSFMFAGAHSFEGAVSALAEGKSLRGVRTAAAANHAEGQGRTLGRVIGAFTNPADKRWNKYAQPR